MLETNLKAKQEKESSMPNGIDNKSADSEANFEIYPVRVHDREPNFILLAVMAFAIFVMITAYFGK
jgi:hypothetical protein